MAANFSCRLARLAMRRADTCMISSTTTARCRPMAGIDDVHDHIGGPTIGAISTAPFSLMIWTHRSRLGAVTPRYGRRLWRPAGVAEARQPQA